MQSGGDASEHEQHDEVAEVERGGLEDALHEGDVDEGELHREGYGDCPDEHLVFRQAAAETAVLEGRDEV